MSRLTRLCLLLASVLFGAFLIAVVATLVPSPAAAAERGVVPQLIITWLLIAVAEISVLLLAVILLRSRQPHSAAP